MNDEPMFVTKARLVLATGQHAKVEGVMLDTFSASAVVNVYDALSDKDKDRVHDVGFVKFVQFALDQLAKSMAK